MDVIGSSTPLSVDQVQVWVSVAERRVRAMVAFLWPVKKINTLYWPFKYRDVFEISFVRLAVKSFFFSKF